MAVALSMLLLAGAASASPTGVFDVFVQQLVSCTATVTDAYGSLVLENLATSTTLSGTIQNLNAAVEGTITGIQLQQGTNLQCDGPMVMWFCQDGSMNIYGAPDGTANCTTSDAPQTFSYTGQLNTAVFATLDAAHAAIAANPNNYFVNVRTTARTHRQAVANPGLIRGQLVNASSSSNKGLLALLALLALIPLLLCCYCLSSLLGCCLRKKKKGSNVAFATFDAAGPNMTLPQTFVSAAPAATFCAAPTAFGGPVMEAAPTYVDPGFCGQPIVEPAFGAQPGLLPAGGPGVVY